MSQGFVKLHRKLTDWEWYDDSNTFRLFMHFLLKANFKDKQWRGITVKKGSFITGYDKLSQELKLSKQQIRTAIKKLKSTGEITHQITNQYSVVTLVNYDAYQSRDTQNNTPATPQPTGEQQASNRRVTPTKNVKNGKKVKNKKKTMDLYKDLPVCIDLKIWGEFIQHRKELKKPLTELSAKKIINKLITFLENKQDPNQILNNSIANGWQGVFGNDKTNGSAKVTQFESPTDRAVRMARENEFKRVSSQY